MVSGPRCLGNTDKKKICPCLCRADTFISFLSFDLLCLCFRIYSVHSWSSRYARWTREGRYGSISSAGRLWNCILHRTNSAMKSAHQNILGRWLSPYFELFKRLRQENYKLTANLGHLVRLSLKKKKIKGKGRARRLRVTVAKFDDLHLTPGIHIVKWESSWCRLPFDLQKHVLSHMRYCPLIHFRM